MTKTQALKAMAKKGFTLIVGQGQNGDYAIGSRIYLADPKSPKNKFGIYERTASISRFGTDWIEGI